MPALLTTLLPILIPYGLQAIQAGIKIFSSNTAPTQADWDALLQSTQVTARDQMIATLKAHGIDPASPAGQAFIALTPA